MVHGMLRPGVTVDCGTVLETVHETFRLQKGTLLPRAVHAE